MAFRTFQEECEARAEAERRAAEGHEKRWRETECGSERLHRRMLADGAAGRAAYWERRARRSAE